MFGGSDCLCVPDIGRRNRGGRYVGNRYAVQYGWVGVCQNRSKRYLRRWRRGDRDGNGPRHAAAGQWECAPDTGSNGFQSAQLRNSSWAGTAIADLTSLGYSTYATAWNGSQDTYMTIYLSNGDRLQFEPTYSRLAAGNGNPNPQADPALNTWQTWDALNGMWYSDNFGGPGSNAITWTTILTDEGPGVTIATDTANTLGGIRIAAGFGLTDDNFDVNVRRLHDRHRSTRHDNLRLRSGQGCRSRAVAGHRSVWFGGNGVDRSGVAAAPPGYGGLKIGSGFRPSGQVGRARSVFDAAGEPSQTVNYRTRSLSVRQIRCRPRSGDRSASVAIPPQSPSGPVDERQILDRRLPQKSRRRKVRRHDAEPPDAELLAAHRFSSGQRARSFNGHGLTQPSGEAAEAGRGNVSVEH